MATASDYLWLTFVAKNHLNADKNGGELITQNNQAVAVYKWQQLQKVVVKSLRLRSQDKIKHVVLKKLAVASTGINPLVPKLYIEISLAGDVTTFILVMNQLMTNS